VESDESLQEERERRGEGFQMNDESVQENRAEQNQISEYNCMHILLVKKRRVPF
jgi:hypothetical protein